MLILSHFSDWHFSGGTAQNPGWRGCTTCPTCTTSKTEGMKMAKRDRKGKGLKEGRIRGTGLPFKDLVKTVMYGPDYSS